MNQLLGMLPPQPGDAGNDQLPTNPTTDQRLQVPGFATYWGFKLRRITDFRLDGRRIGDLPEDFGFSARYTKNDAPRKAAELIAVANALTAVGVCDADLTPGERPDFMARRRCGRVLSIEHSDIMPPCPPDAAKHVQRELAMRLDDDPQLRTALGARCLVITLEHVATPTAPIEALTAACPADHVGNNDARKLTAEIAAFMQSGAFPILADAEQRAFPSTAETRTLSKYRATFSLTRVAGQPSINVWSHRWRTRRSSLFQAASDGLVKKQADAAKYPVWPDWLVLNVVEQAEDFMDDLHEHQPPNLMRFRRVFILLWREFKLFVTVWTPQGRYQLLVP